MAALKNIFRSRKTEDNDESTSPGAEDHVTEDGAGARSLRFAGPEDDTDVPKSKGGGIKFETPPPDSKDSKKGKKNKPKQVRVVIEDDTEGSGKKTKKAAGKTKSQPPPTVSSHRLLYTSHPPH